MNDVTRVIKQIESGDPSAADRLLPLVYDQLRKLAAAKLAGENPGQTLQGTALVHEAYLRLVDASNADQWDSRGHFYVAAAEAMRRILVENARRKKRLKRGGGLERKELNEIPVFDADIREDLISLDAALDRLASVDAQAAELIKLRYFAGLSMAAATKTLGISASSGDRLWAYSRAWLYRAVEGREENEDFVT